MIKNISNLGDSAVYCDFGDKVTKEINSNVIKYFESLKKNKILGITNITPSYNKLIISYDLEKIRHEFDEYDERSCGWLHVLRNRFI